MDPQLVLTTAEPVHSGAPCGQSSAQDATRGHEKKGILNGRKFPQYQELYIPPNSNGISTNLKLPYVN